MYCPHKTVFEVGSFHTDFGASKKKFITPVIDFDLGDEPKSNIPNASARLGNAHFSVHWTGTLVAPATGQFACARAAGCGCRSGRSR
ncbi:hypothetical protein [Limnoglobus roseus]|uniref:hypothetical protein n=1 Tax=Limnoglobus roseus TaxID=2598579 RepID=UPI0011EAF830|nr:hypothetical protein [Limnoglobus roseus]